MVSRLHNEDFLFHTTLEITDLLLNYWLLLKGQILQFLLLKQNNILLTSQRYLCKNNLGQQ